MAKKPNTPMTVIRGGRVVDIKGHSAPKADILVKGDTIVEIGPKVAAPELSMRESVPYSALRLLRLCT